MPTNSKDLKVQLRKDRPYYLQIGDHLSQEVQKMKVGDRLPSERDLADRFNVDRATLRRAMINLEQEGYIVRQQGRGTFVDGPAEDKPAELPKSTRIDGHSVAMIIPDTELPSHQQMLKGVLRGLAESGYRAWTSCALLDPDLETKLLEGTIDEDVMGVITVPLFENWKDKTYLKTLKRIVKSGKRVVLMEQYVYEPGIRSVMMDKVRGGFLVAEHLVMSGHRKIAMFSSRSYTSSGNDCHKGFQQALTTYGVEPDPNLIFDIPPQECANAAYQKAIELFSKPPFCCTAIYAAQFSMCYGIHRALKELGLDQEIELAGEDLQFNPDLIHLTHIRQPFEEIGRTAVDLLLTPENSESGFQQHALLQPKLIVSREQSSNRT